jgi:prevent-host-death family protein
METTEAIQTIPAAEAEADFHLILDRVERGETVVITRDGRSIARMSPDSRTTTIPEAAIDRERVQRAINGMRELRKRTKPVSLDELLASRDEGRR